MPPRRALPEYLGFAILVPGCLRLVCVGESVDYRSLQLLGQALFQAFIFWQEGGPNSRYLCTFPVRGELACREGSDN